MDEQQQRIHRRLVLVGRGPAAFFHDACVIVRRPEDFAAATHLVGHAMREIESGVRDAFEPLVGYEENAKKQRSDRHSFEIRQILTSLGIADADPVARAWLNFAGETNPEALNRYAHRAQLNVRAIDDGFLRSWANFVLVLDRVLSAFEDRFLVFIEELDRLLAIDTPSEANVKRLQQYIVQNITTERYFFERLTHTGWLEPLREAGVFAAASRGYWPVADYVRRSAASAPEQVAPCLFDTPRSVSFWTVDHFLDAVLRLPVAVADRWTREWLLPWIADQESIGWRLPEKLAVLTEHLLECQFDTTAVQVTATLLSGQTPTLSSRLIEDELDEYVQRIMPKIAERSPEQAFELSLNLLQTSIDKAGERARFDTVWRPSVQREDGLGDELLNVATSLVRDTAIQVLTATPECTGELFERLMATDLKIARRLALYVLSEFPSYAKKQVCDLLFDEAHLRRSFDYREYALVLRQAFPILDDSERARILRVLDRGPDLYSYRESFENWQKRAPSADELQKYLEHWRLRFLTQLDRAVLPETYRLEFSGLVAKHGEIEERDEITVRIGSPSPKSADELRVMTSDEIVKFLGEWTPSHLDEGVEGLGDALRAAARTDSERFSADAAMFCVDEPVYVSRLISGIDEAFRNGASIAWPSVLTLCEFGLSQPTTGSHSRLESTWVWVRQHVAWFLSHALSRDDLPDGESSRILAILRSLLEGEEPRSRRGVDSDNGFVFASMNSVQGVALEAMINFAAWRKTLSDELRVGPALEMIDRCLRIADPILLTTAARRFLTLWWVDDDWTRQRVGLLFPTDDLLWAAAWKGYVHSSRAYRETFEALSVHYERAIAQLDDAEPEHNEPTRRLAMHLSALYLNGDIEIDDPRLSHFFERASGTARGTVHWLMLRAAVDHPDEFTELHWAHVRELWDARLAAAERADAQQEFHWFGWLFELLPDSAEWGLRNLRVLLERGLDPDHDSAVIGKLGRLAPSHAALAFQCLRMMADADVKGHGISGWGSDAERVLVAARDAGDAALRDEVLKFVNRLGARGVLTFRNVVSARE
ncbi:MAG TPA: hypothetical protein VGQ21_09850 [Thermoanaerobaculia bacterium]|jgi:hypothetical protein|nr:hypothetical protein [Thermoanaerobaculia bacterium]